MSWNDQMALIEKEIGRTSRSKLACDRSDFKPPTFEQVYEQMKLDFNVSTSFKTQFEDVPKPKTVSDVPNWVVPVCDGALIKSKQDRIGMLSF